MMHLICAQRCALLLQIAEPQEDVFWTHRCSRVARKTDPMRFWDVGRGAVWVRSTLQLIRCPGVVPQAFEAALVNSLPQQLSFIGLPCTCTLLSYQAVPGYTVEAQLKEQTGLTTLLGEAAANDTDAFAAAPGPACAPTTTPRCLASF